MVTKLYSDVRDEIRTGDLLAWEITKISSIFDFILILYQKIFKVKFSHVAIAVRLDDRVLIVEATPPRVRIFPVSMCDDFYLIKTNMPNNPKYLNHLFKHLGKKYSLFDLIKGMLGFKNDENNFYCSELAHDFYKAFGLLTDESSGITPQALVDKVVNITGNEPIFVSIDKGNQD